MSDDIKERLRVKNVYGAFEVEVQRQEALARIEALEAQLEECLIISEENADNIRLLDFISDLLDFISDKIGIPHDQDLSQENFSLWFNSMQAQLADAKDDTLRLHREKCAAISGALELSAQLASAREALEPFAKAAEQFTSFYGDNMKLGTKYVTVGMLRCAAAVVALEKTTQSSHGHGALNPPSCPITNCMTPAEILALGKDTQ